MKAYPVKTRRKLPAKDKWVRLGTAFELPQQINIVLDSLPLWKDWDGSLVIFKSDLDTVEDGVDKQY